MADMTRADDFVLQFNAMDVGSAALAARLVVPRNAKLVKSYAVKNAAYGAAPVLTVASAGGNLSDTHTIPTGGAAGDISEQDYRDEANNSFAEGTQLTITVGTPSAGDTAGMVLVLRPL